MDLLAPVRAFDRFQRDHPPLAIPIAVLRNFSDQGAGNASVLIAYWAFFSIFPLLLLFATILGFLLHGDRAAQQSIVHSTLQQFPIVGDDLRSLGGSATALGIGLATTIWAGLGVTVAAQNGFSRVYAVPRYAQPDFLQSRLRGVRFLAVVGVLQVLSTIVSGLVSGGLGGVWLTIGGIAVSLALDLVLFGIVFRLLAPRAVARRELWPGVVLAAVGWEILQTVGGVYVQHVIKGADRTYGTFATVIGLLAWLYLGARIVMLAAEINVVLTRRLWPRSIMDPPVRADREARAALAKMEERDDKETVEIAFHPPDTHKRAALEDLAYAVAPEPEPGERARAISIQIATPDLHTLTVAQVLQAIGQSLDGVPASPEARRQARDWIDAGIAGAAGQPADAEIAAPVQALAAAARRALGLAGG